MIKNEEETKMRKSLSQHKTPVKTRYFFNFKLSLSSQIKIVKYLERERDRKRAL